MANNIAYNIGDILFISSQVLIAGDNISISGYTDVVNDVSGTRFFVKSFRYSLDGINYSDWNELSNLNLQSISGDANGLVFFEFRYIRAGSDTDGTLEFISLQLTGNATVQVCNNTATVGTIFEDLCCNNALTSAICTNLLRKMHKSGIVPEFIVRGDSSDDEDYIALWGAICTYFALFIAFMDNFDKLFYHKPYIQEYIKQKGLYLSPESLFGDLQFLSQGFYDEIRKRGTIQITKKKINDISVDGEWLRLLNFNNTDEFLIERIKTENLGWCVGNSSPLYNGTYQSMNINKTPESDVSFIDKNSYELLNSSSISLTVESDNVSVMRLEGNNTSQNVGLGFDLSNAPIGLLPNQSIVVDDEIDYEITFNIKSSGVLNSAEFHFGFLGLNINDVVLPNPFRNIGNGVSNNIMFVGVDNICKISNQYYQVRLIIYSKNSSLITDPEYSLINNGLPNNGQNLKFNDSVITAKIAPCIYYKSNDPGELYYIRDYKVRPLIRGKNILNTEEKISINTGVTTIIHPPYIKNPQFLQIGSVAYSWNKNNNENYTDSEMYDIVENYLIPYSLHLVNINLTPNRQKTITTSRS